VCVIAGFRPVNLATVPLAMVFMVLIAVVFAALGVAIGSSLEDMQGFQLIMNFMVLPIFFLSGALFPLTGLPKALQIATAVDPLTYGIDGMRTVLLGRSHFGAVTDLIVLSAVGAVLLVIGAHRFSKIEI
jgi:ABC-2 type transport system permease protein